MPEDGFLAAKLVPPTHESAERLSAVDRVEDDAFQTGEPADRLVGFVAEETVAWADRCHIEAEIGGMEPGQTRLFVKAAREVGEVFRNLGLRIASHPLDRDIRTVVEGGQADVGAARGTGEDHRLHIVRHLLPRSPERVGAQRRGASERHAVDALALRLVQDEIRYLFKGMDGGNYIPQAPAQTWSLRYGDCKAKTLLLLALLRQLGIEAEAVAASSQFGDRMPQRLPSAGAFDHVLVRATIAGKSLWLDGTASGTRLADLDDTPPFRYVLPLRAGGSDLMPVPMHAPTRPIAEIAIDYDQRAGLGLPTPFEVRLTMRGQMAEMMHVGFTQMSKEQRDQAAQGLVGKAIGDAMLSDSSLDYDAETASATVTAKGIVGSPWSFDDSRFQ